MSLRTAATVIAAVLASLALVGSILDVPPGANGGDQRSVLLIIAGLIFVAVCVLSLFGDIPLRLPGRAMLPPRTRDTPATDRRNWREGLTWGESDGGSGRGWEGTNVERLANEADIPPQPHRDDTPRMATKSARKKRQPTSKSRTSAPTRRDRVMYGEVMKSRPRWQWRTFPVFFAFVSGMLVFALVNGDPQNRAAAILVWVSVFGFGYGIAHLFVTNVIVAGRAKQRARAIESGVVPAEYFEEETVYPDEAPDR